MTETSFSFPHKLFILNVFSPTCCYVKHSSELKTLIQLFASLSVMKTLQFLLRHLWDPMESNPVSKFGDSLSPLTLSLNVSAERWSATTLEGGFPKAGQQDTLGAEAQTASQHIWQNPLHKAGALVGRCSWLKHPPGKQGTCDAG